MAIGSEFNPTGGSRTGERVTFKRVRELAEPRAPMLPGLGQLRHGALLCDNDYGDGCRQVVLILKLRAERGIKPMEKILPFDRHDADHAMAWESEDSEGGGS